MTHTQHTSNLAHAINHTPMSAYQWLIVALAVILNMLDGFEVLAIVYRQKHSDRAWANGCGNRHAHECRLYRHGDWLYGTCPFGG
ncbi:hypothetical protein [Moraxella bovoculi]|nr:hypothetical protein [Moraxella bovoculi]